MAIKLPDRLKFLAPTDAKQRVFLVIAAVIGVGLVIYLGSRYLGGGTTVGGSVVATPPPGVQTVPGSATSSEFQRAVTQANLQAAQSAQMTGGSAVPTLQYIPNQGGQQNCQVICSESAVDTAPFVNDLVRQGKLAQQDANTLLNLAKDDVSVEQYEDELNRLVREGKLTPEQARLLLEQYKKQHRNNQLKAAGAAMDPLIKSGQLPIDVANQLLNLQKNGVRPEDYAAELNRLAREGKITPEMAARLLAQYRQQQQGQKAKQAAYALKQLAASGALSPDVANALQDLQDKNATLGDYAAELNRLVQQGKLTPETAAKLLAQYKGLKATTCSSPQLDAMVSKAQNSTGAVISDIVKAGRLSQADANNILALQQGKVSANDLKKNLDQLVAAKRISNEDSSRLQQAYSKEISVRAVADKLLTMQCSGASEAEFNEELKKAVAAGLISPEDAAGILEGFRANATAGALGAAPTIQGDIPGSEEFAALQQRLAQSQAAAPAAQTAVPTAEFQAAAAQAAADEAAARRARIEAIMTAMGSQSTQLISSWQPATMSHVEGSYSVEKPAAAGAAASGKETTTTSTTTTTTSDAGTAIIKAGSIMFGVLDTEANSDYPDTPVMATIVAGKYKGARLLGKIIVTSGPNKQQQDRLSLVFNLMDMESWPHALPINAFAIDPDTARTVLASNVNYHYLKRYGALFAGSFLSGYASAISSSGATTQVTTVGTTVTNPPFSPRDKLAIAAGKVGDAFTQALAPLVNTPPTVRIYAGVGIGLLFMSEVTGTTTPT